MKRRFIAIPILAWSAFAQAYRPTIPKVWDEKALADWATPVAGLDVRPTHISAEQYYTIPVDNLKTYPVYLPGREPAGYWDTLSKVGPKPMLEPQRLKSEADWISAGRELFERMDHLFLRTIDPDLIALVRRGDLIVARPDGTALNLVWVPTKDGVALGFPSCVICHTRFIPDAGFVSGAPIGVSHPARTGAPGPSAVVRAQAQSRVVPAAAPFNMGSEPLGMWLFRAFGVPWDPEAQNQRLKDSTQAEFNALLAAGSAAGAFTRWNGSPYFPTKVPDLIGIRERKYIDHTATHLNRGISDLMRYAALVMTAEATDFGPYHMLGGGAERAKARRSDEALYALALYIESLKPPKNPNPVNPQSAAGEKIFQREGCPGCHTAPLYTVSVRPSPGLTAKPSICSSSKPQA